MGLIAKKNNKNTVPSSTCSFRTLYSGSKRRFRYFFPTAKCKSNVWLCTNVNGKFFSWYWFSWNFALHKCFNNYPDFNTNFPKFGTFTKRGRRDWSPTTNPLHEVFNVCLGFVFKHGNSYYSNQTSSF